MKIFLPVVLILYSLTTYAQNNTIDSLQKVLQTEKEDTNKVNTLLNLSYHLRIIGEYKNALHYANEAAILSEKLNFKKGIEGAYGNMGWIYFNQNNYPEALKNFNSALKVGKLYGDKAEIAKAYTWIGQIYFSQDNYPEAMKFFYAALKSYVELKDKQNIANCLYSIGNIFSYLGDDSEALKNFLEVLKIREELGDKIGIASMYNGIGSIYYNRGNFTDALQRLLVALKLFKELGEQDTRFEIKVYEMRDTRWGIQESYKMIGNIYERQGEIAYAKVDIVTSSYKFLEALKNYLEALKICEEIKNKGGVDVQVKTAIAGLYTNLGNIYIKLKQLSIANDYLKKSLQLSTEIEDKVEMKDNYSSLSNLDSIRGNYKKAYEHYKMYILYHDNLVNEESKKKSLQTTMQYEFDKKETLAKATQDKKDALTIAEIKNQKIIRNFSYAGTIAIFGFAGYGFYRYRRRRKLQSRQEMLTERLRISRELHDDIGSTLGSISIYSEVAKSRTKKNENAEEALSKIGITSRELIDKMSDIVWSLNPNNESFEQLQNRMTAFAAMILVPRGIVCEFTQDDEIKKIQLTAEQRKNIFLIYKEAIHNIAKYAESKKVNILLNMEKNIFRMLIQDDGRGFDMQTIVAYNGNGIKNMQARAKEMGARLHIISGTNAGTSVELTAPI